LPASPDEQLVQRLGQARGEAAVALGVEVEQVPGTPRLEGFALKQLALDPLAAQALGDGEAGDAAAGDEDLHRHRRPQPTKAMSSSSAAAASRPASGASPCS